MAENRKKEEKKIDFANDKKLSELLEKFDREFTKEMAGRPYLLVATSGYEIGRDGDKSTLASQWSWRSNVLVGTEDSDKMAEFLANQLKEVSDHPAYGVKKKYKK
ncbi:MAG: hypothetical protein NTX79_01045 [Candidatus Micrarchaeota archaeon]|nr:hypothetical protein [Candidatus Micrarchaeota archaeon]